MTAGSENRGELDGTQARIDERISDGCHVGEGAEGAAIGQL